MPPPTLFALAAAQCVRSLSSINDLGATPYEVARPILEHCTVRQLRHFEQAPEIAAHSDSLWQRHIQRDFPDRIAPQSNFREAYSRLEAEKSQHLGAARDRLLLNQRKWKQDRATVQIGITDPAIRRSGSQFRSGVMQQLAKQSAEQSRKRGASAGGRPQSSVFAKRKRL